MSIKTVYQLNLASGLLKTALNPNHELIILSESIDWESLEDGLKEKFSKHGRRAKSLRLMVGLHILKHRYNLSDETVCNMLEENIYFRAFCGIDRDLQEWESAQILDPSTMCRFRERLGTDGMQVIENVIKNQLKKNGKISGKTQVVDTTAMEKNIAYPTDTGLLAKGIERTVKAVQRLKKRGLTVYVRSFKRLVRKEILKVNKLGKGRRERIAEATKRLAGYAKEVLNAASEVVNATKKRVRKSELEFIETEKEKLKSELKKLEQVISQAQSRLAGNKVPAKEKIFSMHEPNVTVIAKGKRKKRYEFGAKVSLSMDRNGYVVGHQEYHTNESDSNTLDAALEDWERTFGDSPIELGADRGYTASNPSETLSKVKRIVIPKRGKKRHPDHEKAYFRRVLKTRNKIEPTIGHLKTDHRLGLCRYGGVAGDSLNVGFATVAWNLKKWAGDIAKRKQKMAA